MSRRLPPPDVCANCGGDIPPRALACPDCGADERSGWREQSLYDGLDLPESTEKQNTSETGTRLGVNVVWAFVGVVLILALVTLALRSF